MSDTLYVIGNGFDRYHDIPSDYRDFGRYLKDVDAATFRQIETYFSVDDAFWWEFEARLADFDVDAVVDYASGFLMSYGAEDWSDAGHHDYQYELERVVEAISSTMRERFADWIRKLPIPAPGSFAGKPLPLDPGARYLNFNYTSTLQRTYGIADGQVLHIHGKGGSPTDQLVLGHGWSRTPTDSLNYGVDGEDADTRVLEGNEIVDGYFSATFKPTDKIIVQQQPFFQSLRTVRQILVMGHSLSEVDAPYFEEIIKNIDPTAVRWKVSYHSTPVSAQASMSELGIDPALSTFARLSEF
jgi:Bacteriophage abortive infection AbiH